MEIKRQITFAVSQEDFDRIEKLAKEQDRSKSSLARVSIFEKLKQAEVLV